MEFCFKDRAQQAVSHHPSSHTDETGEDLGPLPPGWEPAQTRQGQVQGCQMVSFQTQNPNLGKFWSALDWKMLIYFMAIWNISQTFEIDII
jgi:hypothetical protein